MLGIGKVDSYSKRSDVLRKCAKRLVEVFLISFHVLANRARLWNTEDMTTIMQDCIIVHNLVVEERSSEYTTDGTGGARNYNALSQEIDDSGERLGGVRARPDADSEHIVESLLFTANVSGDPQWERKNRKLRHALVEHNWNLFGREQDFSC